MKTLLLSISILISTLIFSQTKTEVGFVQKQTNTDQLWLSVTCSLHNTINNDSLSLLKERTDLVPNIKCPKKFNYTLAFNFTLNGLTKLVYHIK